MRIAMLLCAVLIAVSLASCTNDAKGTLAGQVQMYGGPGANGKQALNGEPGVDWPVTVSSGSKVVATARSDSSGRFTFHLPAGTYTLVCGTPQKVTIRSGAETRATSNVDVP